MDQLSYNRRRVKSLVTSFLQQMIQLHGNAKYYGKSNLDQNLLYDKITLAAKESAKKFNSQEFLNLKSDTLTVIAEFFIDKMSLMNFFIDEISNNDLVRNIPVEVELNANNQYSISCTFYTGSVKILTLHPDIIYLGSNSSVELQITNKESGKEELISFKTNVNKNGTINTSDLFQKISDYEKQVDDGSFTTNLITKLYKHGMEDKAKRAHKFSFESQLDAQSGNPIIKPAHIFFKILERDNKYVEYHDGIPFLSADYYNNDN